MSDLIGEIKSVIEKHQTRQGIFQGNSLPERIELTIAQYQNAAAEAYQSASEFRDRMMVDFRAIELILASALNSSTHKEKDSHLRIVSKLMGTALETLRGESFDRLWGARMFYDRDPFRCDFPVREMKERIYELEKDLEEIKKKHPEPSGEELPPGVN
jgi:hypothetical protein